MIPLQSSALPTEEAASIKKWCDYSNRRREFSKMITKILEAMRGKQNASENNDRVKVHVRQNGSLYVKGRELAQSAAWRAKVKELIDADLAGRKKAGE